LGLVVEGYSQAVTHIWEASLPSLCSPRSAPARKGTSIVRLIVDKDTGARLKALCSLASKLWNEVNYARRRQFFGNKGVDLKATYKEFYGKYKALIGSATAQQVLNKNNEAWKSFFNLLKAKKEGKLPPFIMKINPPGDKKKGKSRMLWVVLRNDQYRTGEISQTSFLLHYELID